MRDYWLTQSLLQAVGWGYVLAVVIALLLAGWAPRRNTVKVLAVLTVLVIASILPIKGYRQYREQQQITQEREENYRKAKVLFDERCKEAGEKIYRTVTGVDGVLLLNIPTAASDSDKHDQNWLDAGLPEQHGGKSYIANFLRWENSEGQPRGALNDYPSSPADRPGYRFVDFKDKDGKFWRYTLRKIAEKGELLMVKSLSAEEVAPYAVSFENVADNEGRANWIAGTTAIVTDAKTGSTLAKGTWYSFEPGLGRRSGHRTPWLFARTCPVLSGGQERAPIRFFVDQVLKPREGKQNGK